MRKAKIPKHIVKGKEEQRLARWAAETAEAHADALETQWRDAVKKWAGTWRLDFSNVYCDKAPADAHCVYNLYANLQPCLFCGSPKDPIL